MAGTPVVRPERRGPVADAEWILDTRLVAVVPVACFAARPVFLGVEVVVWVVVAAGVAAAVAVASGGGEAWAGSIGASATAGSAAATGATSATGVTGVSTSVSAIVGL